MASSSSSAALEIPEIGIGKPPKLRVAGRKYEFINGKWDDVEVLNSGKDSLSIKRLTDKVTSLKEQINFLKVKLDVALDILTARTIEVEELQHQLEDERSRGPYIPEPRKKKKKKKRSAFRRASSPPMQPTPQLPCPPGRLIRPHFEKPPEDDDSEDIFNSPPDVHSSRQRKQAPGRKGLLREDEYGAGIAADYDDDEFKPTAYPATKAKAAPRGRRPPKGYEDDQGETSDDSV